MTESGKGNVYILSQTILWGVFPVITAVSFASVHPIFSLCVSSFFAAVLFAAISWRKKTFSLIFNKQVIWYLLSIGFILGIAYYGLIFLAIKNTSAGNVALLAQTEILFSFLFFEIYKKNRFTPAHLTGLILMVAGSLIILLPKSAGKIIASDWLVILASAIAPLGNHFTQTARKLVNSENILFFRSIMAFLFFAFVLAFLPGGQSFSQIWEIMPVLLINGFVIFGFSKILWIEGIHRIPVTKALAFGSAAPAFTLIASWLVQGQAPTSYQLLSLPILIFGLLLLLKEPAGLKMSAVESF